jgi:putative transposase
VGHPPRPDIPGALYHVASRGSNKEVIFFDNEDRGAFLNVLARVTLRHSWVVLAYCQMTTHYHLVVRVPLGGLSDGMRLLNTGFSRRTNRRHGRTSHLFRNRFFSVILEEESHILEVCRYVVLNPVRAGMCRSPSEWPWSSYRSSAGLEVGPSFLATSELLGMFGTNLPRAQMAYRAFVRDGQVRGSTPVSDTAREV